MTSRFKFKWINHCPLDQLGILASIFAQAPHTHACILPSHSSKILSHISTLCLSHPSLFVISSIFSSILPLKFRPSASSSISSSSGFSVAPSSLFESAMLSCQTSSSPVEGRRWWMRISLYATFVTGVGAAAAPARRAVVCMGFWA